MEVLFFEIANSWSDFVWGASYLLKRIRSIFSSIFLNARKNRCFFLYRIPLFPVGPSIGFPCNSEVSEEIFKILPYTSDIPKLRGIFDFLLVFFVYFLLLVLSPQNSSRQMNQNESFLSFFSEALDKYSLTAEDWATLADLLLFCEFSNFLLEMLCKLEINSFTFWRFMCKSLETQKPKVR